MFKPFSKLYITLIVIAVLIALVLTLVVLRGDEDTWICQNGKFVKHGNPGAPMPKTGCGQSVVSPTPSLTAVEISKIKIYLVALNDQGKTGEKIGCGDSIVAIGAQVPPTRAPLTAALQVLFSIKNNFYGQSGLYNSLYQSNLSLQSATIKAGKATINLTGSLQLGGVCDNPRVDNQIKKTALQFPTVKTVEVFVNGVNLQKILSEK